MQKYVSKRDLEALVMKDPELIYTIKHIMKSMDGCHLLWIYQGNQLWMHHCKGVG